MTAYILNLSCPDRQGIVHAVSGFLLERKGNIEEAAQYNDPDTGLFFMRVQFACDAVVPDDLRRNTTDTCTMFNRFGLCLLRGGVQTSKACSSASGGGRRRIPAAAKDS